MTVFGVINVFTDYLEMNRPIKWHKELVEKDHVGCQVICLLSKNTLVSVLKCSLKLAYDANILLLASSLLKEWFQMLRYFEETLIAVKNHQTNSKVSKSLSELR